MNNNCIFYLLLHLDAGSQCVSTAIMNGDVTRCKRDRQLVRESDRQRERPAERQTDRWRDRVSDRVRDRQTDRETG